MGQMCIRDRNVSDLKSKKEEYGGKKTPDQIMEYINEYLPEDIAVLSCEAVPELSLIHI